MAFDKHKWVKREIIASDKLNRIENGVDEAYKIINEELKDNISDVSDDLRAYKKFNDAKVKMVSDNTGKISDDFQDYIALNDQAISDLQNQIDGAIDTWYYHGVPTLNNLPASQWENDDTKNNHLRDLYFDLDYGRSYRFAYDGVIYKWILIEDEDVAKALAAAAAAQDTADGKRRVFGVKPYPPYDEGDLWVQGSSGDIKVCVHYRTDVESFYENDWELASKYTDDTKALEVQDNLIVTNALVEDLTVGKADVEVLNAATARISSLESDHVSVNDLTAANGEINNLKSSKASITELDSAVGRIDDIESDYIKTSQLNAVDAKVTNLDATKASISQLNAGIAEVTDLTAQKADIDMANVNNAWIENGVIKNNAVKSEQVQGISANKITAGTIDASKINVTNLNADNLTVGTINGQRIGNKSIDLTKLSEEVPTKEYLDEVEEKLQGQIDGQTETWSGDEIPLLNNYPAVDWDTDALKRAHIGDIYYVVNAASEVDGYTYRFAEVTDKDTGVKSFEWVLVKDTQITKALQDILDIQGEISDIKTFDNQVSSWQTNTDEELSSLKTRATTLETNMGTKVSTNTFNELKQTVDENSSTITSLSDTVATKADGSTVSTLSNTVNAVKQTADTNSTRISNLTTTVDSKADGSTVETLSQKATEIEQDLDGFKTTVSETYQTQDGMSDYPTTHTMNSAINQKASEITSSIAESYSTKDEVTGELTNYYTKTESDQKSDEFATSIASVYQTKDDMSDYSTTEQMNSAIKQKADSITSTVSSTYATKTSVPTKVSQLTNDSGYQNSSQVNTIAGNKASAALSDAKDYADDNFDSKGSASAAQEAAISAAAEDATTKANAAEANAKNDTTNKLKSYYTKTQTDSAITQESDNILSTVSTTYQTKADMDDYSTTAEMNSAIDQKASSITTTVSQTYATKTSIPTKLGQLQNDKDFSTKTEAQGYADTAKQAAIDDATSKYYNKTQTYTRSEIEQKAGDISLSVAKEEVSKVEVGGRNLVLKTATLPKVNNWRVDPGVSLWANIWTITDQGDSIVCTRNSNNSGGICFKLYTNQYYLNDSDDYLTLSFLYKSNRAFRITCYLLTAESDKSNFSFIPEEEIALTEEWTLFKTSFHITSDFDRAWTSIMIAYSGLADDILEIKKGSFKLEKGNKATDWTPAPEDVEAYTDTQVNAAKAEIKVTTDNISSEVSKKVGNSEIISKINQSAESVQIQASKVNIEGATLFTNGRLSQSSLNNAYDAKGAAGSAETNAKNYAKAGIKSSVTLYYASNSTTAPNKPTAHVTTNNVSTRSAWNIALPTYNESYPYLYTCTENQTIEGNYSWTSVEQMTYAAAISSIKTTANNAAPKSSAVTKSQRIYYRKNTSGAPATPGTATANWVTTGNDGTDQYDKWTTKVPPIKNATTNQYLYLYTCEQRQLANGNIEYTTVLLDDSTTVISGGNIITGTVNANAINATSGTFNTANIPVLTSDKINAGAITAEKLDTTDINNKGVLTVGAINGLSTTLSGKAGTSDAIYRQQTIYYRNTTDSAPNVNKTWLSSSGTGYNNWSLKVPKMMNGTTKYPYLFVAVQYQTVNQKDGTACECTIPQKDDSLTIIDGGNITTGTIDATKVTVTNLNADNIKSGTLSADRIAAGSLTIGKVSGLQTTLDGKANDEDIPTKVSQLTNDSEFQTSSQVTAAVTNGVSGKADKTAAVAEEQYIYISKASGTTSVNANNTWVTETGDKQNTWSTKRPTYSSSYPVLFIAKQKKTVSGTVTCTTPIKDDTTTIIDGGHITTGTIDATKVSVTNLNADNIKSGKLQAKYIQTSGINIGMSQVTDLNDTLDTKLNNEDFSGTVESISTNMTSLNNLISSSTTSLTQNLNDATAQLASLRETYENDYSKLSSFILTGEEVDGNVHTPYILLGTRDDGDFIARITNKKFQLGINNSSGSDLVFREIAYLSPSEVKVTNQLSFGNFAFYQRSNGHFSLKFTGGVD